MHRHLIVYGLIIIVLSIFLGYNTFSEYISQDTLQYFIITLGAFTGVYILMGIIHIIIAYFFSSVYFGLEQEFQLYKDNPPPKNLGMLL